MSEPSHLDLLRRSALFGDTAETGLAEVASLLAAVNLETGATVFRKGEPGDSLYLVSSGRVRVHEGERTLDELGAGEVFGEMALLDQESRSASVSTLAPTRLLRLEREHFYRLLESHPEISRAIIGLLSRRLRARMTDVIENQRYIASLYRTALEGERVTRELQLATEVQSNFLPQSLPQLPGWEFSASWQPAREVSGDFYDFLVLEPELGLAIADVADKGMPAALFMALARSTLRSSVGITTPPERSMAQVNRLLCADAIDGMFVTMVFARLDPRSGALTYVNAGHNPPLLARADGTLHWLGRTGILLGFDETASFAARTVHLEPDDVLLFYTDGVTEAAGPEGLLFGEERLAREVIAGIGLPAERLMARLGQKLDRFSGATPRSDDRTLLLVRRRKEGSG